MPIDRSRLGLAALDAADAAAHGLGDVGAGVEGERDDAGPDLVEADADHRQCEEHEEHLDQQRRAAHEIDVSRDHPAQRAARG